MFPLLDFKKKRNKYGKFRDKNDRKNKKKLSKFRAISLDLDILAEITIRITTFQTSLDDFWNNIGKPIVSTEPWEFRDNLIKIGLQYEAEIGGVLTTFRDNQSYYEMILADYSIIPQNNQTTYTNMFTLYNEANDLLIIVESIFDTWKNTNETLKVEYDQLMGIFTEMDDTNAADFEFEDSTKVKGDFVGTNGNRDQINIKWNQINDELVIMQNWINNIKSDFVDMTEWLRIYQVNVSIELAQQGATLGTQGGIDATWLANDSIPGSENFLKQWNKKSHIVENKLFNFSKKKYLNNSSEQINKIKQMQQMKALNSRSNHVGKNFSVNESGNIYKYSNHTNMRFMKFAYQNTNTTNKNYNERTMANSLNESVITERDISDNYLIDSGGNGSQTYFKINNIDNSSLDNATKFNRPCYGNLNKIKVQVQDICCNLLKDKAVLPNPHVLDHPEENHQHYFPINNNKYGLYIHNHSIAPHKNANVPPHNFQFFTHRFSKYPLKNTT